MRNLPQIYCDMDGVLADFKKGAEKATGVPIKQWMNLTKDAKWDPIRNDRRFWEDLPWMSDGKTLWNFIRPYKPDLYRASLSEFNTYFIQKAVNLPTTICVPVEDSRKWLFPKSLCSRD